MLRRTILTAAGAVLLLVGAVAASGRSTADPYAGTWSVANKPGYDQNTPWKNGGTITVTAAHRGDVEPYSDVHGVGVGTPVQSECLGFPNTPNPPTVSAWYLLSYNWGGTHGTMAGCISNFTGQFPHFWGEGTDGYLQSGPSACGPPGTCLNGYWLNKVGGGEYWTFAATPASAGTTKTVNEPAPGGSTFIESPELPTGGDCAASPGRRLSSRAKFQTCKIEFGTTHEGFNGTAIAEEGDLVRLTPNEFVFLCWLSYDFVGRNLSPARQLLACVRLAVELLYSHELGPPEPALARRSAGATAGEAAAGCRSKVIGIAIRKRKGKMVVLGRAKHAKLRASSLRYSCSASGNTGTLTLKGPADLRKAVGKKLGLMVYRAKNAPRAKGKLTFTFGW